MENTKGKILDIALKLFPEKGFDGTSMQDIAERLGLTKAALYRHFAGKDALLDALIAELKAYYEAGLGATTERLRIPASTEELYRMSMAQIRFTVEDTRIVRVRRFFALSQFRDARIAALAEEYFHAGPERLYTVVFSGMTERGLLREADASLLAFEYVTPIGVLIHLCDREPVKKEETLALTERFVTWFIGRWRRETV